LKVAPNTAIRTLRYYVAVSDSAGGCCRFGGILRAFQAVHMKRVNAPQGFAGKSLPRNRNRRALPAVSELFQALIAVELV
jgi:hypothetical protein